MTAERANEMCENEKYLASLVKERKWREGYKVTRRQGNRYISASAPAGLGMKIYEEGKITKRAVGYIEGIETKILKYGPLGVFASYRCALKFMELNTKAGIDGALFSCLYLPSKDRQLWRPGYRERNICSWLNEGEVFADKVKPIEKLVCVKWEFLMR